MPKPRIAEVLGVHVNTVANYLAEQADDLEATVKVPPALTVAALVATLPPDELRSLGRALAGGEWDDRARRAAQRRLVELVGRPRGGG